MNSIPFYIHWAANMVAGNPRVNREPGDKYTVLCAGWTRMDAADEHEAVALFRRACPEGWISAITTKP